MFLSRRYRPSIYPFYVLVVVELLLTIGCLTLTGIAAPNTYRTKLWQDGADNGFNSSPTAGLYAAANYRSYSIPPVWAPFITNYNLVVAVLSMFFLLVKSTMYMLHVFPPIVSTVLHIALLTIYAVSVGIQASPDNSDPQHRSNGPVWYITKNCNVSFSKDDIHYCQQAKATFACFTAMAGIFAIYAGLSFWSCFPSKQQLQQYREKQRQKREKKLRWAQIDEVEKHGNKTPKSTAYTVPDTPGWQQGMNPATPRAIGFNFATGSDDLPLRNPMGSTITAQTTPYALRSPGISRTPMTLGPHANEHAASEAPGRAASPPSNIYFPPPPKQSTKK